MLRSSCTRYWRSSCSRPGSAAATRATGRRLRGGLLADSLKFRHRLGRRRRSGDDDKNEDMPRQTAHLSRQAGDGVSHAIVAKREVCIEAFNCRNATVDRLRRDPGGRSLNRAASDLAPISVATCAVSLLGDLFRANRGLPPPVRACRGSNGHCKTKRKKEARHWPVELADKHAGIVTKDAALLALPQAALTPVVSSWYIHCR